MPNKIVHMTTVHRAHDARILYKECRSVAAAGYDTTLLAPHDREEIVDQVLDSSTHVCCESTSTCSAICQRTTLLSRRRRCRHLSFS